MKIVILVAAIFFAIFGILLVYGGSTGIIPFDGQTIRSIATYWISSLVCGFCWWLLLDVEN